MLNCNNVAISYNAGLSIVSIACMNIKDKKL